jgi:hypothetical protein
MSSHDFDPSGARIISHSYQKKKSKKGKYGMALLSFYVA